MIKAAAFDTRHPAAALLNKDSSVSFKREADDN
jgi:hypothetical protein